MLRITVSAETSVTPAQVLALAGTDFSTDRAMIWPNVTEKRLEVHERGETYAEVTEGGTDIARFFWERSRYEWSEPGRVVQTVIDSNVLEPGSTWELRVAPHGAGSTVEMTLESRFRRGMAGQTAHALNRLGGKRLFGWMLRSALRAVERESARSARPNASAAGGPLTRPCSRRRRRRARCNRATAAWLLRLDQPKSPPWRASRPSVSARSP